MRFMFGFLANKAGMQMCGLVSMPVKPKLVIRPKQKDHYDIIASFQI